MRIGVPAYRFDYYTNLRTIVNKLPDVAYVPVRDLYGFLRGAALRVNRVVGKPLIPTFNLNNQFEDFDLNKVDLLHFSNGISYGKIPWISSFETILPRFENLVTRHQGSQAQPLVLDNLSKRGLEALCGSACKQIIAWSRCAANIQKNLLNNLPPIYTQPILEKMVVLAPPQEVIRALPQERQYSTANPIRFLMVGAAFFRKGGRETFEVFEKLAAEGLPIHLILVSSLRLEPYAAQETEADVAWAKGIIASQPAWLEYYEDLPNAQVLALADSADVGLLPTWADTYGLSVIEMQAGACPVITTDIRAIPEMNDPRVGWMINVPKNALGEALYTTPEKRENLHAAILGGLEQTIREIVANPAVIAIKGEAAAEKIKLEHSPENYAEALRQIYQKALSAR
jgi:glycosyltransferase involved in cell wall biosynthesis